MQTRGLLQLFHRKSPVLKQPVVAIDKARFISSIAQSTHNRDREPRTTRRLTVVSARTGKNMTAGNIQYFIVNSIFENLREPCAAAGSENTQETNKSGNFEHVKRKKSDGIEQEEFSRLAMLAQANCAKEWGIRVQPYNDDVTALKFCRELSGYSVGQKQLPLDVLATIRSAFGPSMESKLAVEVQQRITEQKEQDRQRKILEKREKAEAEMQEEHRLLEEVKEDTQRKVSKRELLALAQKTGSSHPVSDSKSVKPATKSTHFYSSPALIVALGQKNLLGFGMSMGAESEDHLPSPEGVRLLMERVGFLKPGDNVHRLIHPVDLQLPVDAHRLSKQHINVPNDPFDPIRVVTEEKVYAIDSATTSEVDDAIGVSFDAQTGLHRFTVYVSDATVHVPFESELEVLTARRQATTTYLPEGAYFMLPHNVVEAATLRADRPCRTFNINFSINPESGDVVDYSIVVGWVKALRRITYDATQDLYRAQSRQPLGSSPEWCSPDDVEKLHVILKYARVRERTREAREQKAQMKLNQEDNSVEDGEKVNGSLPDPLVKVDTSTCEVQSVEDQILGTLDARLAVAELMIAANEVCARIARENGISIPFRGSRPLSVMQEAVRANREHKRFASAAHVVTLTQQRKDEKSDDKLARAMVSEGERLRGLTRAIYSATPLYHNGLDTDNYCHATSPLRRYPDMLVHHQLKTLVAQLGGRACGVNSVAHNGDETKVTARGTGSARDNRIQTMIPDFMMTQLCQNASSMQQKADRLQDRSTRFWVLKYLKRRIEEHYRSAKGNEKFVMEGIVGYTHFLGATPHGGRGQEHSTRPFRTDVYVPDIQLLHYVHHNSVPDYDYRSGPCRRVVLTVQRIDPYLDILELSVINFHSDQSIDSSKYTFPVPKA